MNNIIRKKLSSKNDILLSTYEAPPCELFNICNCKTAMCRAYLPDESCYYYRYFKKLIEKNLED